MHREFGDVTTDDASNWDLSTTRDGLMLGSMLGFQAGAAGITDEDGVNFYHRLMFAFTCAHTAHLTIFGLSGLGAEVEKSEGLGSRD